MKNIHILPTPNPSRLMLRHGELFFFKDDDSIPKGTPKNQHIYITSDEKIKKGNWCLNPKTNKVIKVGHHGHYGYSSKKIILTTDQELIFDGVQAINDEFLEWFVKNTSCEEVDISTYHIKGDISGKLHYKIIIPKEEPKGVIDIPKITEECGFPKEMWKPQEHPKTFKELFANTGIEPTTDENGNIQYNFKAKRW